MLLSRLQQLSPSNFKVTFVRWQLEDKVTLHQQMRFSVEPISIPVIATLSLREAFYITSVVVNVDVIIIWSRAQTRNRGKIPCQDNDESGTPRNSEIADGDIKSSRYTFGIGVR